MAHAFAVTDGTTTFSLTTTNAMLSNYDMAVPNGDEETVVDTVDLLIYGTTGALMQTAVRSLNALLESARRRQTTGVGPRVYVTAQLDSDASSWRSEIIDARLEMKENALAVWANLKFEARLYIERKPYWEGQRAQIAITNQNASNDTAGLTMHNPWDSGNSRRDNFFQLDTGDVTGDLPTPLEVQLTNTNGAARGWKDYWLAVNAFNDSANFTYILEGEDKVSGYGTTTVDASSSGGNYNLQTGSGTLYMYWDISASMAQDCAGYPFTVLVRFASAPPDGWVAPLVTAATVTAVLDTGAEVELSSSDSQLINVGTVFIPPAAYATSFGALRFGLKFRFATSQSADVDFIMFCPAHHLRNIYQRGLDVANNGIVVIDDIEQRYYWQESSVDYSYLIARGTPLMVYPGLAQRVYFLVDRQTGGMVVADTVTAKAYYRPRRLLI